MDDKLFLLGKAIAEASIVPEDQRVGQYVFNTVYKYLPKEADALRGGFVDPFYKDHCLPLFWTAVADLVMNGFEE